jgi:hypothetical protein
LGIPDERAVGVENKGDGGLLFGDHLGFCSTLDDAVDGDCRG